MKNINNIKEHTNEQDEETKLFCGPTSDKIG